MPLNVTCPSCRGACVVDESRRGGKVKCPRCGGVFVAGGGDAPEPPARAAAPPRPPSARVERQRRRRPLALLKSLAFTAFAAALLAVVAWNLERQGVFEKLARKAPEKDRAPRGETGFGPGFHIMPDEYWAVFDDPKKTAKAAEKPAPEAAPAAGGAVAAEGLVVHPMKEQGPYSVVNEMGGLVPSAVGVWVSPNRLGQGQEAFYLEPGEEVTVTHWVVNFGGFKVYRVLNAKKRPGPRNKMHEAGWILGLYLQDKEGEPIK